MSAHPLDGIHGWIEERLRRQRSPVRAFLADLRDNSDIFIVGLTVGICAGCFGTVLLAFLWAGAL